MGILSSGHGEDSLQISIAVLCIVVSLVVTSLVPMMVPEYDADPNVLEDARQKMENFTGESMISSSPWQLYSIRTPFTANAQQNIASEYGWIYGSIDYHYELNGEVYLDDDPEDEDYPSVHQEIIRLDPTKKSSRMLSQGEDAEGLGEENIWFYADNWWGNQNYNIIQGISDFFGWGEVNRTYLTTVTGHTFDFTGYMYHFEPTYRISTQNSSETKLNSDMASLNIIWYDTGSSSGISGGLVLQSDKTKAIIANYSATDIIASVSSNSQYATKYLLNFNDIQVYMYIMFDNDVVASQTGYADAWAHGKWSIAFSSPSADGLLDIFNSNDLSSSVGNLIDTYISIFTFDMPNCPLEWQVVFWVVCVLPLELCLILFLSRFGVAGVATGILGSALAFLGVS